MLFRKSSLSVAAALVFGAFSVLAVSSQISAQTKSTAAAKDKAHAAAKDHVAKGSVVAVTNDALTLRSGKKDMVFKLDSSTQKPSAMAPGNEIAVTYRDVGKDHVANSIEMSSVKSFESKTKK